MEIHFVCSRTQQKQFSISICLSVLSVDTITFEGVCGSKQSLVGDFNI